MATWLSEVNLMLPLSGQAQFADASAFNTDGTMEKIQFQAKYLYKDAHNEIWRVFRPRWTMREFSLSLTDGDNTYDCDTATSPEYFVAESMRITGPSGKEVPCLRYVDYAEYVKEFPALDESEGQPMRWYIKPRTNNTSADVIAFSPPPDASYTAKFLAYLKPADLTEATSVVFLPAEYCDIIRSKGRTYLEIVLSEGKAPAWAQFLEELITACKAITLGPVEQKPKFNTSFRIEGRRVR